MFISTLNCLRTYVYVIMWNRGGISGLSYKSHFNKLCTYSLVVWRSVKMSTHMPIRYNFTNVAFFWEFWMLTLHRVKYDIIAWRHTWYGNCIVARLSILAFSHMRNLIFISYIPHQINWSIRISIEPTNWNIQSINM